jgi:3-oxoacyl-[acyl-carrier-protein] synthase III
MRLVGLSSAVPKNTVASSAACERFAPQDVDRLVKNTGVLAHREAVPGTTAADLCLAAADRLIEHLAWPRDTIDAILFVTQTPDVYFPGTSHRLQHELKLSNRCLCLDVNQGCSGFTHGVILMRALLASGIVRRGLLLAGEVTTGTVRPGVREVRTNYELGSALLFGDAGSAAAFEQDGADHYRSGVYGADGSGMSVISVPGGGFKQFVCPELFEARPDENGQMRRPIDLRINAAAFFSFTIRRVPPLIEQTIAGAGWKMEDVDSWVLHQASKFILEFLMKRVKIPFEKAPMTIEEFGNTSSASIPLTMVTKMSEQLSRPTKSVLLGFGSGLSWSGVALETDRVAVLPLIEV